MPSEDSENWPLVYRERTDVYEDFSRHHDRGGRVLGRLLEEASFSGKTVIEIGCGPGGQTRRLAELSRRYIALDISAPMLDIAKRRCSRLSNIDFIHSAAQHLPLRHKCVDVAFSGWALDAIEPVEARDKAISEVERVLAPGGHVWVLGNHWEGEFMEMRGESEIESERTAHLFMLSHGFELVDTVETDFAFPSLREATRVLGFIFGANAVEYLHENPRARLTHNVIVYHKRRTGG